MGLLNALVAANEEAGTAYQKRSHNLTSSTIHDFLGTSGLISLAVSPQVTAGGLSLLSLSRAAVAA